MAAKASVKSHDDYWITSGPPDRWEVGDGEPCLATTVGRRESIVLTGSQARECWTWRGENGSVIAWHRMPPRYMPPPTPTVPPKHENCRCVLDLPAMSTVEWHFDGPPTKGQVPDGASCLVSRRGNTTLSVTCGSVARNWWNNGHIKHSPYAWAYLPKVPPEPKLYEPPTTWQDPNKQPPTESDADEFGKVAVVYIDGELTSSSWEWVRDKPKCYRQWIPIKRLAEALQEDE